jgi:hypothetical protein
MVAVRRPDIPVGRHGRPARVGRRSRHSMRLYRTNSDKLSRELHKRVMAPLVALL